MNHVSIILYQPRNGFSQSTAVRLYTISLRTSCCTGIAPSCSVPLADVNVTKWDLNVPMSAAAIVLKIMEAVIKNGSFTRCNGLEIRLITVMLCYVMLQSCLSYTPIASNIWTICRYNQLLQGIMCSNLVFTLAWSRDPSYYCCVSDRPQFKV